MKPGTRLIGALVQRALDPMVGVRRVQAPGLTILGYHRIDDSGGHLSVRLDHFRSHLDWIQANGIRVVDVTDSQSPQVHHTPCVAITFDDGYLSVAEAAWPELKSRGWPATLYVVSGFLVGRGTFPWDRATDVRSKLTGKSLVRDLSQDGLTIGSHSLTHPYLPALALRQARTEIHDSRRALEDFLQHEITSFSYPMGGWNIHLRNFVAEAGYSTAVTCVRGRNLAGADPLALRRSIIESAPVDFERTMKGYYDWLRPFDWWRESRRQRSGESMFSGAGD